MKMKKIALLGGLILVILTATIVAITAFTQAIAGNDPIPTVSDIVTGDKTTVPTTEEPALSQSTAPETDKPVTTGIQTTPEITQTVPVPVTTEPVTTTAPVTTEKPVETTVTTTAPPATDNPMGFVADLSEYEKYMNPTGDDWDDAYLLLVNADNPIEKDAELRIPALSDLISSDTITAYKHSYRSFQLNETALQALTAMFIEAKAEGVKNLYATSAYRTYSYQNSLFNKNVSATGRWYCEECEVEWVGKDKTCPVCGKTATISLDITTAEKEANVATYSCRPGTSDHQTGLAVDIIQSSLPSEYLYLIQDFGKTEAGIWLAENSYKFGFVLRFPADKEDVTGIIYEPWHFRYVGREHATRMYEMNLCLEEYVEYLNEIGYFED
ncbi:MAG: D-alanyl-D-alanine carboxypeptidase family protein [Eubacteriales bacterium]